MAVLVGCPACHAKISVKNKKCRCGQDMDEAKKRKGKYAVQYWVDTRIGNKHKREKVGPSIKEAQDADGKRKVQKRENKFFEILPDAKMTFEELTKWYVKQEKVKAKAYFPTIVFNLNSFNAVFGDYIVNTIKPVDLENYQAQREKEGLSKAYIDSHITAARTMINKAFDNDLVGGDIVKVFKRVDKLLKKGENARDRILSKEEFDKLVEALPAHTKAIFLTGFYTGMRKGEVLNLTWDKVDLKARMIRLHADDTKESKKKRVPICDELKAILDRIPKAIHDNHVFLFKGKPIKDIRTALKNACEKVGIAYGRGNKDGFVFHDTRHCHNTIARRAGVASSVRRSIHGHASEEMDYRYDTVEDNDLRQAAQQIEAYWKNVDNLLTQDPQNATEG